MADIVSDNSNQGNTVTDIFETLSNLPDDKPEKDDKIEDDDKEEKEEDKDEIPLREPKSKDKEDEEEEDEEINEEDEDDEEDEEEIEEQEDEDEVELAKIPTRAQIKAKYPNIFKEFKALDKIFYREKAYAEIFPSVKDANSARAELGEYSKIQEELLSGDVAGVLGRVKQTNPKAYDKIAANIIESLIKVDKDSYIEPARMVMKTALNNVYTIANQALKKDASNKRAEQIQIAAELIHESLFGTSEVSGYNKNLNKVEDEENPEIKQLKSERAQLQGERFNEAHNKVTSRFNDLVTRTLEKNIDTRNSLTSYVKSKLITDVKDELDKQLISDNRFSGIVKKLYERAKENNYSQESLDNIITALKNKAGSILPDVMRAKRGEALKGSSNVKSSKTRELSRERENKSEDATTRNSRKDDKSLTRNARKEESEEPRPGESALDYLNRKLG